MSSPSDSEMDVFVSQETKSPKRTFNEAFGQTVVAIAVGKTQTREFTVHLNLISERSPVFEKMFTSGFKESQTKSATLPEDDPNVFDIFLTWLYRGTLPTVTGGRPNQISDMMLKLVEFATKYLILELRDRATTGYIQTLHLQNSMPSQIAIDIIYGESMVGSKLRLFVAKEVAYTVLTYREDAIRFPDLTNKFYAEAFKRNEDLSKDVLDVLRSKSGVRMRDPKQAPHCEYHEHPTAVICPFVRPGRTPTSYEP